MSCYLLNNYSITPFEAFQSLFVSEYGLRHLELSDEQKDCRWGHRFIALIEFCPLIGILVTIIEFVVAKCLAVIEEAEKKEEWVFQGSQRNCNGPVDIEEATQIINWLVANSPHGITFNQKKLVSDLRLGVCTAMSFDFINKYFDIRDSEGGVEEIRNLEEAFKEATQKMRTWQAVYNTIEVTDPETDYTRNKIQAMANAHGLQIDYASAELDVTEMEEEEIKEAIDVLPEGLFFLRTLKPANNEKREETGHSLVYIKGRKQSFFYDSNEGVRKLSRFEHSKVVLENLKECHKLFQVHKARFYRFVRKTL